MKFKRSNRSVKEKVEDGIGDVNVRVVLVAKNRSVVKGNITRQFTITAAKVSDVFKAIEKALFE